MRGEGGCTRKIFSPDQGQGPGLASALALAWPLPSLFFFSNRPRQAGLVGEKRKEKAGPWPGPGPPRSFFLVTGHPRPGLFVKKEKKRPGPGPGLGMALALPQARPREFVKKEKKRPGPNLAWPWPGLAPPKLMLTNEKRKAFVKSRKEMELRVQDRSSGD